jgi:hypothetical protein
VGKSWNSKHFTTFYHVLIQYFILNFKIRELNIYIPNPGMKQFHSFQRLSCFLLNSAPVVSKTYSTQGNFSPALCSSELIISIVFCAVLPWSICACNWTSLSSMQLKIFNYQCLSICAICERARGKQHLRYMSGHVAIKTCHCSHATINTFMPETSKSHTGTLVCCESCDIIWYWRRRIIFQQRQFAWILLRYTTVVDYYCPTGTARCQDLYFAATLKVLNEFYASI